MPVTLPTSLVFIDRTVADYQTLINGVSSASTVVVLEPHLNGVEQITRALSSYTQIESIHIVSHGEPGCLLLGSTRLTSEAIAHYANQLQQWKAALADGAELVLYGCRVAAGAVGAKFIEQLTQVTGATIAASDRLVGHASLGGSWNLTYQPAVRAHRVRANAAPHLAFSSATREAYAAVLAVGIPNLVYGVVGNDIRVLNLTNGSSNSVGALAFPTFAIARESATGRIYYVENVDGVNGGRVAYWDPETNTNTPLTSANGGRTGVDTIFLKLAQSVTGLIYGLNATDTNLYTIDQITGAATVVGAITGGGFTAGSGDIAFDPNNPNRLFVSVVPGPGIFNLYTVDTNPTSPTFLEATFIGQPAGLTNVGAGSLAFGQDGELYVTSQVSGVDNLYRLNQTTAAPTLVGPTGFGFGDFGSLPTPTASVDISVTGGDGRSTVTPGSPITYTITVSSPSSTVDLRNINVNTLIPSEVTNVNWTATITGGGSFPTPADQSGSGNTFNTRVNLNTGASVVYTVTGIVSPNANIGNVLTATTTISVPTGINDPSIPNNVLTDTTTVATQSSTPPNSAPVSTTLTPGSVINVPPLSGTDPDGSIASFTILTLPPASQGTLFLGNPASGGTPVTLGQTLQPNQANQLFFQSTTGFTGVTFNYTTTDNSGASDATPATVTLSGRGSVSPPPPEEEEDDCKPGIRRRGNRSSNTLVGTPDEDTLIGFAGNDRLYGRACGDLLDGGLGQDILRGAGGNDTLRGKQGNDRLFGERGTDVLNGGLGNDRIDGGLGNDLILGGIGSDRMAGRDGNDRLDGGRGIDVMLGGRGNDAMDGGGDRDILRGDTGNDILNGRLGADSLIGGFGDDQLFGGVGNDRLVGRNGQDLLVGGAGRDRMFGDFGIDQLDGGRGGDVLNGGRTGDTLRGRQGNDLLIGGLGWDTLIGAIGRDTLRAGSGQDTLDGGYGADTLVGNFNADTITGGAGRDRFVYLAAKDRGDRITDFNRNSDRIDLSRLFRSSIYGRANKFAAYVRRSQVGADTIIRLDLNGDRAGGFRSFITLENVTANTITANNFIF
ncbi:DUF4347 domain-containing protein [Oscillatoria sp. FACHB-1407]|uniref:DUF4347 domain-containing protein n=1 Tax=Oscillatoria sp. FACHB-1407 TaxID=2692847 RepID=UPI001682C141|nr:DUF4347 domain-containing protein [Oscillatoria sp. FACHB-1407]MBD2463275.1 DUF4347 domain-containing protein [Oscillatoria sp. FACHB-1407]